MGPIDVRRGLWMAKVSNGTHKRVNGFRKIFGALPQLGSGERKWFEGVLEGPLEAGTTPGRRGEADRGKP